MKASELSGKELDHWVARAQGWTVGRADGDGFYYVPSNPDDVDHWFDQGAEVEFREVVQDWKPSTNWTQAGPIIEREVISVYREYLDAPWLAAMQAPHSSGELAYEGDTPLIAAMRAFVAGKFGEDLPD